MLILVRHGRTQANREQRLQGRLDQDLDDHGRRQAVAIAAHLAERHEIAAVVSSPLKRAAQTAAEFGIPVEFDERWLELAYGEYEGAPHADVPSEVWRRWGEDPHFTPAGGESLAALDERVRAACADLLDRAEHDDLVVVSHVSPMKSAVAWALGVDIGISWNCHLDHASVCRIAVRRRRPILQTFNETVAV